MNKSDLVIAYKQNLQDIFGLSYYYLKHKEDSEDVCMDVFEIWLKYKRKKDVRNARSWLLETTRRVCLERLRKRKRLKDISNRIQFSFESGMENTRDEHLYKERLIEVLLSNLDELKENQREVLHAFYFDNLSYSEIAEKYNISVKDVKSRLQNGKRNLSNLVKVNFLDES